METSGIKGLGTEKKNHQNALTNSTACILERLIEIIACVTWVHMQEQQRG